MFTVNVNCLDKVILTIYSQATFTTINTLSGSFTSISVKFQTNSICILEKVSSSICKTKHRTINKMESEKGEKLLFPRMGMSELVSKVYNCYSVKALQFLAPLNH